MAIWGEPATFDDQERGVDWGSALVILLLIFGLFLEALWAS